MSGLACPWCSQRDAEVERLRARVERLRVALEHLNAEWINIRERYDTGFSCDLVDEVDAALAETEAPMSDPRPCTGARELRRRLAAEHARAERLAAALIRLDRLYSGDPNGENERERPTRIVVGRPAWLEEALRDAAPEEGDDHG